MLLLHATCMLRYILVVYGGWACPAGVAVGVAANVGIKLQLTLPFKFVTCFSFIYHGQQLPEDGFRRCS